MSRARVDVDLGAVTWNLQNLRRKVGSHPEIMAVVKANAYGHGAVPIARALKRAGAEQLAVATPEEGLELRHSNIKGPITVLGPSCDSDLSEMFDAQLTLTVLDKDSARRIAQSARAMRQTAQVHVKVDTGMHRFGLTPEELPAILSDLADAPFISVYSLATHLANADHREQSNRQIHEFHKSREALRKLGLLPENFHLANSAGAILRDARCDDIIRPGIALYGIDPTGRFHHAGMALRPALSVKSRLASIREIPAGAPVGYGSTVTTKRPTRLG
ncbi:MAG: alanine racemase, partial [Planctomycetota bacterium]|nr:alanine racemase [Planctomycetota bacterium]